jgi:endo-1,4-beta-mannosidase
VTEPVIYETENDILFHKAKNLSRFTKRMKAMSSVSTREQNYSTSSDDESLKITKLKTIRKNNEYHPTVISAVAAEQQLNFSRYSTPSLDSIDNKYSPVSPSLDSIDNKYSPVSPIRTRITTTFSNISFQRPPNPIQIQRPSPTMGIKTLTLTRTFAFDRACMEKYGRIQEKETESINIQTKPVSETIIKKQIELPPKKTEQMYAFF